MKIGEKENANSQKGIRRSPSQEIEVAFLTGRVVEFIENVARNAGVPSDLLAQRVLSQLGNSEVRQISRPEETVSPLPENGAKRSSPARKVAVGRRPRRQLSGQALRQLKLAFKNGTPINSLAKKYHVSWKYAHDYAMGEKEK